MSQPDDDHDHDRLPGPSPRLERVIKVVFLVVVVVALVVVAWAAITTFQSNARVAHAKTHETTAQTHVNQGERALKDARSAHAGAIAALKNDEVQFGPLPSVGTVSTDEGQIIAAAQAGVKSTAADIVQARAELPTEQAQLQSAKAEVVAAQSETRSTEVWLIVAIGGGVLAIVIVLVLFLYARRRRQHSRLLS